MSYGRQDSLRGVRAGPRRDGIAQAGHAGQGARAAFQGFINFQTVHANILDDPDALDQGTSGLERLISARFLKTQSQNPLRTFRARPFAQTLTATDPFQKLQAAPV
jgi:hypothetical protein